MTIKVKYQATDWNLRTRAHHCGDGPNCKFGHVRADLIRFFVVYFPSRPGRKCERLILADDNTREDCQYPKV